jgi:trimeric autotransporter adhesin
MFRGAAARGLRQGTVAFTAGTVAALALAGSASANEYTVDSARDASDRKPGNGVCDSSAKEGTQCTLRAAIEEVNASGERASIVFGIPGRGVKTISPSILLPGVTERVKIDGYTQKGARENTSATGSNARLRVELTDTSFLSTGLRLAAGRSTVRGLVISGFDTGLELDGGGSNKVLGNFIGTDPTGTQASGNNTGISISESSGNQIGGTAPAARNVVSANDTTGISIFGLTGAPANDNRILGNLIGTTSAGSGDLGNGFGDNNGNGIRINGQDGTTLNNIVGGTEPASGNVIAHSTYIGVNILEGTGNSVLGNSIYGSGSQGINTDGEGVAPNDDDDPDVGANNRQNYPVITDADSPPFSNTVIHGTLSSVPNTTYRIEFFSNPASDEDDHPSDLEEGRRFLGATSTTTDSAGNASFSATFAASGLDRDYATATATDPFGNTSEFSNGRLIDGAVVEP